MAGKRKKSTKLSATNSESLSFYTFYLDRALESDLVRQALVDMGARVQRHKDHFADDARDVDPPPRPSRNPFLSYPKAQFSRRSLLIFLQAGISPTSVKNICRQTRVVLQEVASV